MGRRNNTKGKEKRLARKEEQMRISLAKSVVDKANQLEDPLGPFIAFRKYNKNGIDAELFVNRVNDLTDELKTWTFGLTKRNMQIKYNKCSWGWNDKTKLEEMTDELAWYLIARSIDGTPLGFSHFRFDLDDGIEVLYCYELQLESNILRRGLGKFMMQIVELIAFTNNMKKVMLTVLKNNKYNIFFKSLNYQLDESSPMEDDEELYPYEILSKVNKKLITNNVPTINHTKNQHTHAHCCNGGHH